MSCAAPDSRRPAAAAITDSGGQAPRTAAVAPAEGAFAAGSALDDCRQSLARWFVAKVDFGLGRLGVSSGWPRRPAAASCWASRQPRSSKNRFPRADYLL